MAVAVRLGGAAERHPRAERGMPPSGPVLSAARDLRQEDEPDEPPVPFLAHSVRPSVFACALPLSSVSPFLLIRSTAPWTLLLFASTPACLIVVTSWSSVEIQALKSSSCPLGGVRAFSWSTPSLVIGATWLM